MEITAKILGKLLLDMFPESDNAFEAIDKYSTLLYNRIMLKDKAMIDYKDELELFIFLNGYKSKIAEMVHKEYLNKQGE
ncbi:hypothetical protein [Rosettibacter firmus]|uniref:hypothetical protein n=1 Tax=Rosettibacter firmus TaxID=3111522 RepID=UPI00336BBB66